MKLIVPDGPTSFANLDAQSQIELVPWRVECKVNPICTSESFAPLPSPFGQRPRPLQWTQTRKRSLAACSLGLPKLASSLHLSKGGYAYFVVSQLAWLPRAQPAKRESWLPMHMRANSLVKKHQEQPRSLAALQFMCNPHAGSN